MLMGELGTLRIGTLVSGAAVLALALSAALTAAAPVMAQEQCWNARTLRAAKVRDLQTLMMVGALQCRTSHPEVLTRYNEVVRTHRAALVAHNDVLKAHFVAGDGVAVGQRAYDRFTTMLANGHAANASGPGFCDAVHGLAAEAGRASPADLERLAETMMVATRVGERCPGE
jgi:hypothetical protein